MEYDFGMFVQSVHAPPVTREDHAYVQAAKVAEDALERFVDARDRAEALWLRTSWAARQTSVAPVCQRKTCTNPAERGLAMCAEHRCQGTRTDGQPCGQWALARSSFCGAHAA